jgi:hypothetical protein
VLAGGFGVTEFQLVLLRRMADFQPVLVEQARDRLGAGRGEMRAANAHWQRLMRSARFPGGARRYHLVLGAPASAEDLRVGDLACRASRWPLPLWPGLSFEVVTAAPQGGELHAWLVRHPDTSPPRLRGLADLTPWSCVVSDLDRAMAPVEYLLPDAPSRWRTRFTAPSEDGRAVSATATFVHGLLQTVEPDTLGAPPGPKVLGGVEQGDGSRASS